MSWNRLRTLLVTTLLSIFSTNALAVGWSDELTVTQIMTEGNTDIIAIYTEGGSSYTTGCLVDKWIFLADNEDRRNRAFSVVLAAIASGKKITLWYSDTCTSWSYHGATSIRLIDD